MREKTLTLFHYSLLINVYSILWALSQKTALSQKVLRILYITKQALRASNSLHQTKLSLQASLQLPPQINPIGASIITNDHCPMLSLALMIQQSRPALLIHSKALRNHPPNCLPTLVRQKTTNHHRLQRLKGGRSV